MRCTQNKQTIKDPPVGFGYYNSKEADKEADNNTRDSENKAGWVDSVSSQEQKVASIRSISYFHSLRFSKEQEIKE